jgi:hypothetical protein
MNENYSLLVSLSFPRARLVVAFDLVPSGNRDLTQNTTEQEEGGRRRKAFEKLSI